MIMARKKRSISPFYTWDLIALQASDKLQFRVHDGTTVVGSTMSGTLTTGQWYHATGTYNSGNITLYIDSSQQTPGTGASLNTNDPGTLTMGAGSATANGLDGSIDDMCYFDYALNQEEVDNLYNSGNGTECYGGIRANVDNGPAINLADAALIHQRQLGLDISTSDWVYTPTTGDVDCNGRININDFALTLRYIAALPMGSTPWCAVN
jgi:hypothetical protein